MRKCDGSGLARADTIAKVSEPKKNSVQSIVL
jgi:hypothetical protein